jgi:hypothetical protein
LTEKNYQGVQTKKIELVESGDDMSPIGSDQEFELQEQASGINIQAYTLHKKPYIAAKSQSPIYDHHDQQMARRLF